MNNSDTCPSCNDHPFGKPLSGQENVFIGPYTAPTEAELEASDQLLPSIGATQDDVNSITEFPIENGDFPVSSYTNDMIAQVPQESTLGYTARRDRPATTHSGFESIRSESDGSVSYLQDTPAPPWVEPRGLVTQNLTGIMPSPSVWFPFPLEWLARLIKPVATNNTKDPQRELEEGDRLPRPSDPDWGTLPEQKCDGTEKTYNTRFNGIYYHPVCTIAKKFDKEPTARDRAVARNEATKECFGEDMDKWRRDFRRSFMAGDVRLSAETAYLANADACKNAEQICPDLCSPFCRITDWFAVLVNIPKSHEVDPRVQKERFGQQLAELNQLKIPASDGSVTYIFVLGVFLDLTWKVVVEVGCEID